MTLNLLEKIQLKDEKNLLIQGLPSSIEKQFAKLSFAKNVTPLLRNRKIDYALVFAINEKQLNGILADVLPALQVGGKLWIAFPKKTSKIVTDLDRDSSWEFLSEHQFECIHKIALDHVWNAVRYKRLGDPEDQVDETTNDDTTDKNNFVKGANGVYKMPDELQELLKKHKEAGIAFEKLNESNKEDFIEWISNAKKDVTKQKRLKDTIDKLIAGKKSPTEK
jgi:hypothetical protein